MDIGSSYGLFVDEAYRRGWQAYGMEIDPIACKYCRKNFPNIILFDNPLENDELPENYFDVITLWGVIEHMCDPALSLKLIRKAIKPGGLIFIDTGDVESWPKRLLGKSWWHFMGQHLYFYSKKTLSELLKKSGFRVKEIDTHKIYFSISSLSNSLKRYPAIWKLAHRVMCNRLVTNRLVPLKIASEMLMIGEKGFD